MRQRAVRGGAAAGAQTEHTWCLRCRSSTRSTWMDMSRDVGVAEWSIQDVDELTEVARHLGWDCEYCQLEAGPFGGRVDAIELGEVCDSAPRRLPPRRPGAEGLAGAEGVARLDTADQSCRRRGGVDSPLCQREAGTREARARAGT